MLAGREKPQHRVVGHHGRDGQHARAQGLSEHQHVRPDPVVLEAEEPARPSQPRLDLVEHEEHAALPAQVGKPLQVTRGRHDNSSLALNGLHEHGAGPGGHGLFDGAQVPVVNEPEPGRKGAEVLPVVLLA
jgi:hypothetical protein